MKQSVPSMILAGACLLLPALGQAQSVIDKRQKVMETQDEANKAIRAAAKEKDYATIEAKAKEIADLMNPGFLELFPKGSVSEKSEAHPDIWEKWDEFGRQAAKMREVADDLRKAAAAKDEVKVSAGIKAVGGLGSGACGGCHLQFNKKRMKKT